MSRAARCGRLVLLAALLGLAPSRAVAHTGALAALELEVEGTRVLAAWTADDFASQGGLAAPVLVGCAPDGPGVWSCPEDLSGVAVRVDFEGQDGQVVVTVGRAQGTVRGLVDPRAPVWEIPSADAAPEGRLLVYLAQGVHHIAVGLDHLVFVLGLLLLVPSARALLGVVTAFTLGHSVTLAVATWTGVAPASAPTEALIAGSILLLARELVLSRRQGRPASHPAGLAAVFGLEHGFGFSGALAEVGLPPDRLGAALFGFNLGVELGQLVFVAALSAAALGARALSPGALEGARALLPWGIGALAGLWFIERVAALG